MNWIPSYIKLFKNYDLERRILQVDKILNSCSSCPRNCQVNRVENELGKCLSGYLPIVSSYTPHFGEEPVLSGTRGAGNIFFGNCNLKCVYCQNYEISQNWKAEKNNEVSFERLAEIMIELQERNCHNIGLVSPTHFAPQILKGIYIAIQMGLRLPIIYNTNGYDSVETLKLFDGVIDIYLPDLKYGNNDYAKKYSKIDNYFDNAKLAITEMYNQVGDELIYNDEGVVVRGLIIRHLILPNDLSETEKVLEFIAGLSPKIHISSMSQFYPVNKAYKDILINRTIRASEYEKALELLEKYNLENGWIQEYKSNENYRPEFNKDRINPFNNNSTDYHKKIILPCE